MHSTQVLSPKQKFCARKVATQNYTNLLNNSLTLTQFSASNLKQVACLSCAEANSASYLQWEEKLAAAYLIWCMEKDSVRTTESVACLHATLRFHCPSMVAMDGGYMLLCVEVPLPCADRLPLVRLYTALLSRAKTSITNFQISIKVCHISVLWETRRASGLKKLLASKPLRMFFRFFLENSC